MTGTMGLDEKIQRMQAALSPVLEIGPDFLASRVEADDMAQTMVRAVQEFVAGEPVPQSAGLQSDDGTASAAASPTAAKLQAALAEIYTCGSGYLANRCDSDCVARTMMQIVNEFGEAGNIKPH